MAVSFERVIFCHRRDRFVGSDAQKLEATLFDRLAQSDEAQIDSSLLQRLKLIAATHVEKIDRDFWE